MTILFDVTTPTNTIILDQGQGQTAFTVTNRGGQFLKARARILPDNSEARSWFTFQDGAECALEDRATHQFVVNITAPPTADPGFYRFRFALVEEENPDEHYVEGPTVVFELRERPAQSNRLVNILLIILVAVLTLGAGGVLVYAILTALKGPEVVLETATATNPALVEHDGTLYLVYRGDKSSNLFWTSYDLSRGENGIWLTTRALRNDDGKYIATLTSPALIEHDGTLYLVYRGDRDDANLYMMTYNTTTDQWRGGAAIETTSGQIQTRTSPTLIERDGRLVLIYRGDVDSRLYVTTYDIRRARPVWEEPQLFQVRDGEVDSSISTVETLSLTNVNRTLQLTIIPLGTSEPLVFSSDTTGSSALAWQNLGAIRLQWTSETEAGLDTVPAFERYADLRYMVFGTNPLNWARATLGSPTVFRQAQPITLVDNRQIATTTIPALAEHDGRLFLVYRGGEDDPTVYWAVYDVQSQRWMGGKPIDNSQGSAIQSGLPTLTPTVTPGPGTPTATRVPVFLPTVPVIPTFVLPRLPNFNPF